MKAHTLSEIPRHGLINGGTQFIKPSTKGFIVHVWINFKELRQKLKFEDVLGHYGVKICRKGSQHQGPCPLPGHTGSREALSFSANLERGIFRCFSCKAGGNLLEFAGLMSGIDLKNGSALRKVAVELQQKFCPEGASTRTKRAEAPPAVGSKIPSVVVNAPLDFELKGLDAEHPYFAEMRLTKETVADFGLGYCSRGLLKGRVAIPLHDQEGRRIGYAGRIVGDLAISESNPCYRFPESRERNGTNLMFNRSLFLYNGHRIDGLCDDLIVVQEIASVWWLYQCGYRNTVALMGSECSEKQADLIISLLKPSGRLWVMPNGGDAGDQLAQSLLVRLSPYRFVRWVKIEDGKQPRMLSSQEVEANFTM